jgi:hypothetical protein
LVFQLDGVDGVSESKWQSLVSEDAFNIRSNERTSKSVIFPPAITHSVISSIPAGIEEATLEVVFSNATGCIIQQLENKLSARIRSHGIAIRSKTSSEEFLNATADNVTFSSFNTLSIQDTRVILNARSIGVVQSVSSAKPAAMAIGGSSAEAGLFHGQIFAIRYYNRKLKDTEIYYNQQIDNVRFGLGLDLNGGIVPYVPSRSLSLSRTIAEDNDE